MSVLIMRHDDDEGEFEIGYFDIVVYCLSHNTSSIYIYIYIYIYKHTLKKDMGMYLSVWMFPSVKFIS